MKKLLPLCVVALATSFAPLKAEMAATTESPSVATKSSLSAEVKIGTGIENRMVAGESETFPAATTQLVGWSRVTGAVEPAQIIHVWKLNGEEFTRVPLEVKSSPFRTYSRVSVQGKSGKWSLEVLDVDKNVIGSKEVELAAN